MLARKYFSLNAFRVQISFARTGGKCLAISGVMLARKYFSLITFCVLGPFVGMTYVSAASSYVLILRVRPYSYCGRCPAAFTSGPYLNTTLVNLCRFPYSLVVYTIRYRGTGPFVLASLHSMSRGAHWSYNYAHLWLVRLYLRIYPLG